MNKEKVNPTEVLSWVDGKIKSSNRLLFIENAIWQPGNERKERLLLQYINAIANQGGGTIVFGLQTYRRRAHNIIGIDKNEGSEFWLKTLIKTNISPVIENIDIYSLRINDKNLLVLTIESNDAPYMIIDDGFYGWNDIKPRKLLEQEIRQLYQNSHKPQLEYVGVINTQGVALLENGIPTSIQFYPKFLIRNAGTAPEKDYKVEFWFPSSLTDANFSPLQQYFHRLDGVYSVFSIPGKTTLFQDEVYTIAEAKLTVHIENIEDFLEHDFLIHLFYSKGKKTYRFKLSETFHYQKQKILNDNVFKQKFLE
ncbi:MAG: ATP-binding protein [Bacteroidales bacterium]|nr:ATP-binding protein [Bacteroidales bacterium]